MESSIHFQILLGSFLIALAFGALVNRSHFCTLGAVSDWVNMGDLGRMRAWFLAIITAMTGVLLLEGLGLVELGQTRPPYRSGEFAWARYLLGGLMFGVGMTLASGCTSKTLVRFGGGNLKSLVVLLTVGAGAYLMTKTGFYVLAFGWTQSLSLDLTALGSSGQDLGALLAAGLGGEALTWRLVVGSFVVVAIGAVLFRCRTFRSDFNNLLGGLGVGLCVALGWWLTGGSLGQTWKEESLWWDEVPLGVATQSYTFVNPLGEVLLYVGEGGSTLLITFGVVAVSGVALGSFLHALAAGRLRLEWFTTWADFLRHVAGGLLMGVGGVLALGCTIGQGVTGASTLALGSFLALGAIILGSATTMKMQYYRMLYEDASLTDAFLSGWADLHLLPQSLRRLQSL